MSLHPYQPVMLPWTLTPWLHAAPCPHATRQTDQMAGARSAVPRAWSWGKALHLRGRWACSSRAITCATGPPRPNTLVCYAVVRCSGRVHSLCVGQLEHLLGRLQAPHGTMAQPRRRIRNANRPHRPATLMLNQAHVLHSFLDAAKHVFARLTPNTSHRQGLAATFATMRSRATCHAATQLHLTTLGPCTLYTAACNLAQRACPHHTCPHTNAAPPTT